MISDLLGRPWAASTIGIFPFYRILCFFLFCSFNSFQTLAQRAQIDSLRKVLPSLHDSTRVDCLNAISLAYSYLDADTANAYAKKAYLEANAIPYTYGQAMALNGQARIAGHGFHDFSLQEKISLQTIQLYKNSSHENVLIEAYLNLVLSLFCRGLFDRSEEACIRAIELSQKTGNNKSLGEAIALRGSISFERGNYEKSFEYFSQCLKIFKSNFDTYNTAIVTAKMGDLYRLAGDNKTALILYYQSLEFKKSQTLTWHPLVDLGDTYYSFEQYDSTFNDQELYLQTIKSLTIQRNDRIFSRLQRAEKDISNRKFDKALALLNEDLILSKKRNDVNQVIRILQNIVRACDGKKDFEKAFYYAKEILLIERMHKSKQYVLSAYKLMFELYDHCHKIDSAYFYYRKFTNMKDSISIDNLGKRLAIYKAAVESEKEKVQIEILSKEKQINQQQLKIRAQQLQKESLLRNILFVSLLLLISFGFILFRNILLKQKNEAHRNELVEKELNLQKLESEKAQQDLEQQAFELEMQALRAQMNPHFIFNSLNAINNFILQNNSDQASEYLTKFSRLMRMILQNSQLSMISLEEELQSLKLYLELEAVRFDDHFDCKIKIHPDIDSYSIKVPPLIIQPYAENAIWHGLMHKEEKGHLQIELYKHEDLLYCKIIDDGIGRKKSSELKSKSTSVHKSMGMQITAERIAILHKKMEMDIYVSFEDLVLPNGSSGGTEVCLKIPISIST